MTTSPALLAEPPDDETLRRRAGQLADLHAGRLPSDLDESMAVRRLTAAWRMRMHFSGQRLARHEAGRHDLEASLRRIIAAAPEVAPQWRPTRRLSWDSSFDEGPYWSPTSILGFRAWEIREGGLRGAKRVWHRPWYEAGCVTGGTETDDGRVPHTDGSCGRPPCGIYAAKEPAALVDEFAAGRFAFGMVELTGKVVEHDFGYRAKRATAVFVAAFVTGRVVVVEGRPALEALFRDPTGYLAERRRADTSLPGPLAPGRERLICEALDRARRERQRRQ